VGSAVGATAGVGTAVVVFHFVLHWVVEKGVSGGIGLALLEAAVAGMFLGAPVGLLYVLIRWLRRPRSS
jgi:NhaP-type Na+/H+ or K+/H+ antiporter